MKASVFMATDLLLNYLNSSFYYITSTTAVRLPSVSLRPCLACQTSTAYAEGVPLCTLFSFLHICFWKEKVCKNSSRKLFIGTLKGEAGRPGYPDQNTTQTSELGKSLHLVSQLMRIAQICCPEGNGHSMNLAVKEYKKLFQNLPNQYGENPAAVVQEI